MRIKMSDKPNNYIAPHEWTNGGTEVLVLRFSDKDNKSYGGFVHPTEIGAVVTAPDWNAEPICGGGIHGWPWGFCIGYDKDPDWGSPNWQVYGVQQSDIVALEGKVKFRTGTLRFRGTWDQASNHVLSGQIALIQKNSSGAASATGCGGAASATGESSVAVVTGLNGQAKAGKFGCIALQFWSKKHQRAEVRIAYVGNPRAKISLKPDTWYRLDARGRFVEC